MSYLICGEEVWADGAPYMCGQGEDEESHHPVHGHPFKPLMVVSEEELVSLTPVKATECVFPLVRECLMVYATKDRVTYEGDPL